MAQLRFRIYCSTHPDELVETASDDLHVLADGDVYEVDFADLYCPIGDYEHNFVIELLTFERSQYGQEKHE